jgi:uncharacterized DUF497 family protein
MKFEWHSRKSARNEPKHRVTFGEAISVFEDTLSVTYPDVDHSDGEERVMIVGLTSSGSVLVVSHSFRDETIRVISARRATTKERLFYEKQSSH